MPLGEFVTLNSSLSLSEARHAARRLKAAGIPSFIRGEAAALVAADPDRAVVSLEVSEEDLEHAHLILETVPPAGAFQPADAAGLVECFPVVTGKGGIVTVEVFFDSIEARTAANLLQAHGIPCHLHGTSEGLLPGCGEYPRLSLDVREQDLERAYEALGFRFENEEEDAILLPDGGAGRQGHIQSREPISSRQVEHQPIRQRAIEQAPVESPTPSAADSLAPPLELSRLDAGSGGLDLGLMVLLMLLAGVAVVLVVMLLN